MNVRAVAFGVAACLWLGLVGLAGCKPSAGDRCSAPGAARCLDVGSALVCAGGTWAQTACRGPTGCKGTGDQGACDDAVAAVGDACGKAGDFACTQDKAAYLTCREWKWALVGACRGARACTASAEGVACDSTTARVGDGCGKEGSHACAEDAKSALACHGGRFALASRCAGPGGCKVKDDNVQCDDSLAQAGDPCEGARYGCSPDGRSLLVCKDAHYAMDEACPKGKACKVVGTQVGCM
jgi:hypothetical protein